MRNGLAFRSLRLGRMGAMRAGLGLPPAAYPYLSDAQWIGREALADAQTRRAYVSVPSSYTVPVAGKALYAYRGSTALVDGPIGSIVGSLLPLVLDLDQSIYTLTFATAFALGSTDARVRLAFATPDGFGGYTNPEWASESKLIAISNTPVAPADADWSVAPATGGFTITIINPVNWRLRVGTLTYSIGGVNQGTVAISGDTGIFFVANASVTALSITLTATNANGAVTTAAAKAVTPGAAAGMAAQTAQFGDGLNARYQPYDAGGVPVTVTGTPTLVSGSAGGFTASVSDGGLYFGAGSGAPNGATYRCTLTAGGTVDIIVQTVTNARSVATSADMVSAITAMRTASQSTDWTLLLRGGQYGTNNVAIDILGQSFLGTVVDPNVGLALEDCNLGARCTVSGGSITIKSERVWSAWFAGRPDAIGCGPFFWKDCDFAAFATVDSFNRNETTDVSKTQSHTFHQLRHSTNGTHTAVRDNVVVGCRFGARRIEPNPMRYIMGCSGFAYVEGNLFDGFTIGGAGGKVTRQNIYDDMVTDAGRFGFGATTPQTYWFYGNETYRPSQSPDWAGEHQDNFQAGTSGTTAVITFYYGYNSVFDTAGGIQGSPYTDDSQSNFNGVVQGNFYYGSQFRSTQIWAGGDILVRNNTVVERADGLGGRSSPPGILFEEGIAGRGPYIIGLDNIVTRMGGITDDDGVVIDNVVVGQTGTAYSAMFDGTFTGGAGVPVLAVNTASRATIKADVLAAFAAKVGGPGAGKGMGFLRTNLPPIAAFAPLANQAASTVITTAGRRVLRGSALAITAGAGTEFQILASDNVTVVRAWGTAASTVSKGQFVYKRVTSSSAAFTAVTATVTIDGNVFATLITTGVATPAQFLTGDATTSGYFQAPANVPASTSRLTFRGKFYFPTAPADGVALFTQESNGCDLRFDGGLANLRVLIKNADATPLSWGENLISSGFALNTWHDVYFDLNLATPLMTLTIDGVTRTYTPTITGLFANNREVSFLAFTSGVSVVPPSTRAADLSVDYNGTLHKTISNVVATANADAWKKPASPTRDFT